MEKVMEILRSHWKEELDPLNIVDLRKIAKILSMNAPTSIEKEDLIEDILGFICGEIVDLKKDINAPLLYEEVLQEKSSRSCDNVELQEKDDHSFIKLFMANGGGMEQGEPEDYFAEELVEFRQPKTMVASSVEDVYEEDQEVLFAINHGYYVEKGDRGMFVFDSGKKSLQVAEFQVKYYGFRNYDTVIFKSMKSAVSNEEYIVDILEINGEGAKERKAFSTEFEKLEQVKTGKKLTSGSVLNQTATSQLDIKSGIELGSRVLVSGKNVQTKKEAARDIISAFSADKKNGVFPILTDYSQEDLKEILKIEKCTVCTEFGVCAERNIQNILSSFKRGIRFVEEGKNAVIIIDSVDGVVEQLEEIGGEYFARSVALKLFDMAGEFSNNGSLTIVAFASTADEKLLEKFRGVATTELKLDGGTTQGLNNRPKDGKDEKLGKPKENVLGEILEKTAEASKKSRGRKEKLKSEVKSPELLEVVRKFYEE